VNKKKSLKKEKKKKCFFAGFDLSGIESNRNTCPKGQTKSKCPYDIIVSPRIATKGCLGFCPEIFCSSLGASWKLWGLSVGFLTSNITY